MPEVLQGIKHTIKELDYAVGRRLRLIRITLGLSQNKVAEKVGCSLAQWQKCENGHKRISVGTLLVIANKLNIPIVEFINENLSFSPRYDLSSPLHKSGVGDGRKIKSYAEFFTQMDKISSPQEQQLIKNLVNYLATKEKVEV